MALRLVEALTVVTIVAFLVVCSICVVFADYLFRIMLLLIWVCNCVQVQRLHLNCYDRFDDCPFWCSRQPLVKLSLFIMMYLEITCIYCINMLMGSVDEIKR